MKSIGILGASGFVGSRLGELAREGGWTVVPFSRRAREGFRVLPEDGTPDFSGLEAVVNLAGEPILGLWTPAKKRAIRTSRVEGTRRVVEALAASSAGPRVLVNASAIGFYGDTGETQVDESSPAGTGFLAETCHAWEAEAVRAEATGVRVARIRIGFVLGSGGAMKLVLPIFRAGLGGNLGNGRQWMSCVHVDDVAGLILWAVESGASGAVNAVMPRPVRNAEFTRTLGRVLKRPTILPAPAFALRTALGGMSAIMLDSTRVVSRAADGYTFRYPDLESAVRAIAK